MVAPPRRHSKPVSSRRYLALRHGRRILKSLKASSDDSEPPKETLPSGYAQLYSSDNPGVKAGPHVVQITQTISEIQNDPATITRSTEQKFTALGPKFALPGDGIYSVFPPQGHTGRPEVLPHLVTNDATLPWERQVRFKKPTDDMDVKDSLNTIPWMACLVFTKDELSLSDAELKGDNSFFKDTSVKNTISPNETLGFEMPLADILKVDKEHVARPFTTISGATEITTNLIFIRPELFNNLFSTYGKDGKVVPSTETDISRYKYFAHVRRLNTQGMAEADAYDEDEILDREFGIVMSHRAGPLTIAEPTQVFVHIVSLEEVEDLTPFPVDPLRSSRVAIVSLYSWTYMCLPANSLNVADAFERVGNSCRMLRPIVPETSATDESDIQSRLLKRISDGYSMIRYRVETGETTVAFNRSPLTPTLVSKYDWDLCSTSGSSLLILDQKLGIMDITYSAAWNLGKTLAMADHAYSSALSRSRKQILQIATPSAQLKVLKFAGIHIKSKTDIIAEMSGSISTLNEISESFGAMSMAYRWQKHQPPKTPDLSYHSEEMGLFLDEELLKAAYLVASSTDPNPKLPYLPPYDEHNTPYSADWVVILKFLCDLMYLIKIPHNYLLTDASHLPQETVRMFHIDPNWIDALLDGALSIGNLVDRRRDRVRDAIKMAFNRYLETPNSELGYPPPVPRYGFYMRSILVAMFPDLKVTMDPLADDKGTPTLIRHEIVDRGVMLGFFNHKPSGTELQSITFTQPAHQLSFTAARDLLISDIQVYYKRIYTVVDPDDSDRNKPIAQIRQSRADDPKVEDRARLFIWGSPNTDDVRTINAKPFVQDLYDTLNTSMNRLHTDWFTEVCPSAAMMAYQLNDPCWQLEIHVPEPPAEPPFTLSHTFPPEFPVVTLERPEPLVALESAPHLTFEDRATAPPLKLTSSLPHFKRLIPAEIYNTTEELPVLLSAPGTPSSPAEMILTPTSPSFSEIDFLTSESPTDDFIFVAAGPPEFKYKVAPASSPKSTTIPILPEEQDLIFSIVYQSSAFDYELSSVTITIPMSHPTKPSLTKAYRGPGATMLSNLRFYVRALYSTENNALQLVLLPRSTRKVVRVTDIKDMSFMLSRVLVQSYKKVTSIEAIVQEVYKSGRAEPKTLWITLNPPTS
ncbi:hypothetical protein TWF192_003200 [Orbilia oligospora]|uniref:Uncharacterized protein n=1 Tax=Orbilia oligospora TaxID=2813651 RepID=A0A6G1MCU6_ORBOL|nr:hypothetical protein TWF679_007917 [Orbilia oligospora]KAF3254439.1 hypothetical protein TWF192_003200 [Orbilia oligospora]